MAEKDSGSTGRVGGTKRLARAKLKPRDAARAASSAERAARTSQRSPEDRKKRLQRIGIGIFAVVIALSMTIPSFAYLLGDGTAQQEAQATEEAAAGADESTDAATDTQEAAETGLASVDASYQPTVQALEEKLKESPDDLATLLNLGNDYMAWARTGSLYVASDEDRQHLSELYGQAISYYDRYLELNDSNAVRVDRALCQFYRGETEEATTALEQLCETAPDYGPAWANLGLVYEYQGEQDKAKEAYQKAVEVDADDEYGAKSFANQRIAAMSATANGGELTGDSTGAEPSDTSNELADALGSGL